MNFKKITNTFLITLLSISLIGCQTNQEETTSNMYKQEKKQSKENNSNEENQDSKKINTNEVDFEKIVQGYKKMTKEELEEIIENSKNQHEIAFAKYFLGIIYIKDNSTYNQGFETIRESSDQYANPFAMSTLARMYYNGATEEIEDPAHQQDIELANFYINSAFEFTNVLYSTDYPGSKYLLDIFVSGNLGFLDTFNLADVKAEIDQEKLNSISEEKFPELIKNYEDKFGPITLKENWPPQN